MTDISKYKNVSLSKDTYAKIDKIRRVIEPHTILSRSQTINILVNKEMKIPNYRDGIILKVNSYSVGFVIK